jgi:hypothetical protein
MRALRLAPLPVSLTVVLVFLLVVFPGRRELMVHIFVLVVATILFFYLVRGLRATLPPKAPSRFDAALRRRSERQERLPELAKLEREVALGMTTAFDLHYRLRPALRRIASELLAARRGIDLDLDREAARQAVGENAWALVRGDRRPPENRFAPGIELDTLSQVVASLEGI